MPRLTTLLLALLFIPALGAAATLRVPEDHSRIQPAIDAASAGDTLRVAPGIYTGPGNRDLTIEGKALSLIGAGPGATLLDCEGAGRGFRVVGGGAGTLIRGFAVLNAVAAGGDLPGKGAGLYCADASPRVERCLFSGGRADYGGGVAAAWGAALTLRNCAFLGNRATLEDDDFHELGGSLSIMAD